MDIKKCLSGIFLLSIFTLASSFAQDTLRLSRQQSEIKFLEENLLLLAEKLNIPQAEALTMQAKLWPNPTLELDEINIGTSVNGLNGTGYFGEGLPPILGNFGRNQQISASIEQLVQTAGKRKKLVDMEKVNEAIAEQYFQDLLRALKLEFRNSLSDLQYLQFSRKLYRSQLESVRQLSGAYKNQVELGNVSKGEYIRLKAAELEIAKQINQLDDELHEEQKDLKLLMNLPPEIYLVITDEGYERDIAQLEKMKLGELSHLAAEWRPDYKIEVLGLDYAQKNYLYERAQRIPDLAFKAGYDRGGNFLYNFFGVGLTMDLPVLNRNQGNIKHAEYTIKQAELLSRYKAQEVENEVILAWQNLQTSITLFREIDPDYEHTLDKLLESYISNFKNRDIGMLTFLDFLEAYLENKTIILENKLEIQKKAEELNFTLGTDLFN
ncbi:TolC family protein [Algoriphagus sp.]|uniref:TolC family protein n=1 Tax=Algoriphagus sp. TaxID=1872435 RepID=UPI003F71893F